MKWPEPTNVKQVHAFLGLGNFYRRFIKDYAIISRPMVDLTCKDVVYNFGDKEKASFEALKAAFTTAPVLQYPNQDHEFHLKTDMSEFTVRGVISIKCDDGEFRPVAYMSHSMTPPKQNYPIHDKEMLAIIKQLRPGTIILRPLLMPLRYTRTIIIYCTSRSLRT